MKRLCLSVELGWAVVVLAGLSVPPAAAKDSGKDPPKEQPITWEDHVVPGPAVTLRLKRTAGLCLIYEGTLDRAQQSAASYQEAGTFYLTVACVDQVDNRDQVALRRTYLDRKRTEVLERGRKLERILPNADDPVYLGPNYRFVNGLRCYAYDAQNNMAYQTLQLLALKDGRQLHGSVLSDDKDTIVFLTGEEKFELPRKDVVSLTTIPQPHVCINDTVHYLFPIFSARSVAPGDEWKFRVPIIIPIEQGTPPRVLPTQFTASMIGRLREVRQTAGTQVAVVDYQVRGAFDTAAEEFRGRFPAVFHEANQIAHRMSGTGTVVVDVEKGRILEKSEAFSFTLFGRAVIPQPADKPAKEEENRAEITSRYQIKLLPPGTRLKNGKVIPPYE
ncbi:MAG: hypothetical protein NTW87_21380 [Planctomycetota bacterium]|nr:hypothetical protein [Planctomycetota bacterium]